jgi:hypothetical protein
MLLRPDTGAAWNKDQEFFSARWSVSKQKLFQINSELSPGDREMPSINPTYNTTSNPWINGTASSQPDNGIWSQHELAAAGMGVAALGVFTVAMVYAGVKNGPRLCSEAYNYCRRGQPAAGDFALGPIDAVNVLPGHQPNIPNQNYVQPF